MIPPRYALVALLIGVIALAAGCRKAARPPAGPATQEGAQPDDAQYTDHGDLVAVPPSGDSDADAAPLTARDELLASLSKDARQAYIDGEAALAQGHARAAVEALAFAVSKNPNNIPLLQALTIALCEADQYAPAVDTYLHILDLAPADLATRYNLAVAYTRLGDCDQAEQTYRDLLRDDPANLAALYNLGTICRMQGKLADARRAWQAYLQQEDENAEVHALLGEVLLQLNQPQAALASLHESLSLAPDDIFTLRQFVVAAKLCNEYGRAATALHRTIRLQPGDAGLWAELGEVLLTIYQDNGEPRFLQDAVSAWRESLAIDADQPELQRYIRAYAPDSSQDD